jgi:hypothetical protein
LTFRAEGRMNKEFSFSVNFFWAPFFSFTSDKIRTLRASRVSQGLVAVCIPINLYVLSAEDTIIIGGEIILDSPSNSNAQHLDMIVFH